MLSSFVVRVVVHVPRYRSKFLISLLVKRPFGRCSDNSRNALVVQMKYRLRPIHHEHSLHLGDVNVESQIDRRVAGGCVCSSDEDTQLGRMGKRFTSILMTFFPQKIFIRVAFKGGGVVIEVHSLETEQVLWACVHYVNQKNREAYDVGASWGYRRQQTCASCSRNCVDMWEAFAVCVAVGFLWHRGA